MASKNELQDYLKRLQELDREISGDEEINEEFITELSNVLNGLTKDVQLTNSYPTLKFINKSNNPDPEFAHEGDSGFDLRAYIANNGEIRVPPGQMRIIPTGLYFEIEEGLEIQVRTRSGLASNNIMVLNSPGTIDSHYRGEIKVILANIGDEKFGDDTLVVKNGYRIAQGVVCPVYGQGRLNLVKVEKLSETKRNDQGFGSTGVQ